MNESFLSGNNCVLLCVSIYMVDGGVLGHYNDSVHHKLTVTGCLHLLMGGRLISWWGAGLLSYCAVQLWG